MPNTAQQTWKMLPGTEKNEIFKYIKNNASLRSLIDKYHLVGMTPEDIRFQHFIETSINKHAAEQHEPLYEVNWHDFNIFPELHLGHGGHQQMQVDMLTEEMKESQSFKDQLVETTKKNKKKYTNKALEKEFRKKFKKNLDRTSEEGIQFLAQKEYELKKLAEADFRRNKNTLAKQFDRNEINRITDKQGNIIAYEDDHIGKQFQAEARKHAEQETERKYGKKLKQGKITPEEYRHHAEKIHEKYKANFDKQFASRFHIKAAAMAIKGNNVRARKAFDQIRFGKAKRYYKKQLKQEKAKAAKATSSVKQATPVTAGVQKPRVSKNTKKLSGVLNKVSAAVKTTAIPVVKKQAPKPKDERAILTYEPFEEGHPEIDIQQPQRQASADDWPQMMEPPTSQGAKLPNPQQLVKTAEKIKDLASNISKLSKALAIFTNPVFWIILGVILIIILIIILISIITSQQDHTPIPGLTMTIEGPDQSANSTVLKYTIVVAYSGTDSILITNPIPANTTASPANEQLSWNLDSLTPFSVSGNVKTYILPVSFQPSNDITINEFAYANDVSQGGTPVPLLTFVVTPNATQVTNGQSITYTIDAVYTGSDPTVTIYAAIPPGTTLVGKPSGQNVNVTSTLISWVLKDNGNNPYKFTFTLQPNPSLNDTVLSEDVYATAQGVPASGNGTNIVWLNSGAPGEFGSHTDWIPGQCSQASLAEVLNAYGGKGNGNLYTIAEVASISQALGVWNNVFYGPFQTNWTKEATRFNMDICYHEYDVTLDNLNLVLNKVNQGHPAIMGAPNHYLVIWKSDSQYIYALDSSPNNFTWADQTTTNSIPPFGGVLHKFRFTYDQFLNGGFSGSSSSFSRRDNPKFNLSDSTGYWMGMAIILTPHGQSGNVCTP